MRLVPSLSILLFAALAQAQVNIGGSPREWQEPTIATFGIPVVEFSMNDEVEQEVPGDFRYGTQRFKFVDVLSEGKWDLLPDGSYLCRVALRSPSAAMISVQFDRWELEEDATVYLYTTDRTRFLGGFDDNNRGLDGTMATAVLPGEEVIIEYRTPQRTRKTGVLRVSSITHGFIDLFQQADPSEDRDYNPGYQSATCNINMICPEAAAWQTHKRSVAMFLRPDGGGCSGNLVNNTQTPGRPYFHMANHCLVANTVGQYVFYFNYESPTCVGSTGPTTDVMTGATLRANYYWSDMTLLELNSAPP
ncbi:MAG TPA: hypothetical protein PK760_03245, partial [Flavobacteriales bacterium]|nr:hypothetical protein [Flavobacteriales bacterium]